MNNEITVILGRKGSGKTYYARVMMANKSRMIAFDPKWQLSDLGVVIHNALDLIRYIKANHARTFRVVYQPDVDIHEEGALFKEFQSVVACAYYTKNLYLFLDEIYLYTSRSKRGNVLENIINSGRHDQISIVATTIRHTDTSRNLTAQADSIIAFQIQEPSDIEYLRTYFGDLAEKLPTLPPRHHIKYIHGKAEYGNPI